MNPLISIIMPAYNAEQTIEDSINSIQEQSYEHWELIVIDDGSSDATQAIVKTYMSKETRIKLLRNNKKGVSSARNLGIDEAHGEYICFLDSDDIYSGDVLKNRAAFMQANNVKATTCEIVLTDESLQDIGWVMKGKKVFTFNDFHGCPVHTNSVMFHRSVLETLRFDESFTNGEDWLMWQRIARMGIDFHRVDNCRIYYRQQLGAVRRNFLKHEDSLLKILDVVYGEDPECPNPDERYLAGLHDPQKEHVILKRRLGLFNYLLLENKFEEAEKVGKEIKKISTTLSSQEIIGSIKYSTMRYYLCHANDYQKHLKNNHAIKRRYRQLLPESISSIIIKQFFNREDTTIVQLIQHIKQKVKHVQNHLRRA